MVPIRLTWARRVTAVAGTNFTSPRDRLPGLACAGGQGFCITGVNHRYYRLDLRPRGSIIVRKRPHL